MSRGLLASVALSIATLALVELGLQLSDRQRPWLDRWIGACTHSPDVGTALHHAPPAGDVVQHLGAPEIFGEAAGLTYVETFDARGIKASALRPQEGEGIRILFMGDSFIQGYDDANTVPQRAYEWIRAHGSLSQPLLVFNAAYSSYSPLIFTVQAKRLMPSLRPDFVVIDIDETDLFDDAVRYRGGVERDEGGHVVAVRAAPEREALLAGCAGAGRSASYLLRAVGTFYYLTRLGLYDWRARRSERLFAVGEANEGEMATELRDQMRHFSRALDELFVTVKDYVPAQRILAIRHPHLRHLQGHLNRKVGELVAAAAARHGVTFFDAQDELAVQLAGRPERYYWNGDMHFNFDGIRAYGDLVGRELLRKMETAREGTGARRDYPRETGSSP